MKQLNKHLYGKGILTMSENKSDVERLYDAIAAKFGVQRKFIELNPMEVHALCQGVNMILQVVRD